MQLCHRLPNKARWTRCTWCASELFVDVECALVFLATSDPQIHPGLGQIYQERVLRPPLCGLYLLQCQICSILAQMNLCEEGYGLKIALVLAKELNSFCRLTS